MQVPIDWIYGLVGGALIGVAVSVMLLFNGRVTGISGIVSGILTPAKGDTAWRISFVAGLVVGGAVLRLSGVLPHDVVAVQSVGELVLAGLLVGIGTVMGSGCTSGHGVCGISRMSPRSLVATLTFMIAGMAMVALIGGVR